MSRATCFATVGLGFLVSVLASAPAHGQKGPTPEQINQAIDQGVEFLKNVQEFDGSWPYNEHEMGMTALAGLALFESEVPRDDPAIVKAEKYVIRRAETCTQTYDLGLAILFLSKLHPNDTGEVRALIRKMAWRLAGGEQGGMWTYNVPERPDFEMPIVERKASQPIPAATPGGVPGGNGGAPSSSSIPSVPGGGGAVPGGGGGAPAARPGGVPGAGGAGGDNQAGGAVAKAMTEPDDELDDEPDEAMPKDQSKAKAIDTPDEAIPKDAPKDQPKSKGNQARPKRATAKKKAQARPLNQGLFPRMGMMMAARGDHSNTQFGMLGVWVAGRYGYDSATVLDQLGTHFLDSQRADGCWGYHANGSVVQGPEAMTCVGMLGLYLAASRERDDGQDAASRGVQLRNNQTFQRGLEAVTHHAKTINRSSPIYYLWSLERLCVALGMEELDGFNWYKAGAKVLVDGQRFDGRWDDGRWGHLPATCLALLFLYRSNLATGIEDQVRLPEYKPIAGLPFRLNVPDVAMPEPGPDPGPVAPPAEPPDLSKKTGREVGLDDVPTPTGPETGAGAAKRSASDGPPAESGEVDEVPDETSGALGSSDPRASVLVVLVMVVLLGLPALTRR
jgi:hypothetical protein